MSVHWPRVRAVGSKVCAVARISSLGLIGLGCSESRDIGAEASSWSLEGRLETIVFEGPQGSTKYFLLPDDGSDAVELAFATAPTAGSGARIGVDGAFDGEKFRVAAFDDALMRPGGIAAHRNALEEAPPEKTRTVAFVMVDYGEGVNVTSAKAQNFMFSTTNPGPTLGIGASDKSVLQFYDETSYGFFGVSGGIEGPLSWTGAAACNGSGGSQLANQLRSQVSTTYGHYIWYYGSKQSACEYGWGSLGNWDRPSSNVWFNGGLFDGAITHEIGHNLGYQHASSIKCSGTPLANDPMSCTTTEYGSAVSIMGNTSNGHMMAIEKWYAGWFKGCNAVRVRSSGTFTLQALESQCAGIQALQIAMPVTTRTFDTPQSNNPSPVRYYYLEYRNGTALDTGMTPSVIVVASDDIAPPNRTCARSVQLDMNPSTNPLNGMTAGQSYTDPAGGVTFSVTSLTPANAVINVTLSAAAMPNTCLDGTQLSGSGPTTCSGVGGGGMSGTGGTGGTSGMGGADGKGGAGGNAGSAGRGGTVGMGGAANTGGVAGQAGATAGGSASGGAVTGGAPAGGVAGAAAGSGGSAGGASGGLGGALSGAGGVAAGGVSGGVAGAASGAGGSAVTSSGGTASGGASGSATGGASAGRPTGGAAGAAPIPGAPGAPNDDASGCSCRVAGSPREPSPASLLALAALALSITRRRARKTRA